MCVAPLMYVVVVWRIDKKGRWVMKGVRWYLKSNER